ncbi:Branched-chain amino acid transport system permease protein LivM (TC 3.A.1.4.1) [hydrothermal vent metagenome]|uniref:Branched-chain amino acid transport system permease protein LivM (TC 3.A.1.4.1) n=1 Tax=hydrothermal vent metagenome TaxID=652676 RepID=A0A3B0TGL4_9ZZZZ
MKALAKPGTGGLLALAAVIAALPLFLENSFQYDIVILVGLNAIVCVGLNLLIGYAGQISLGHAGFLALGAYASAILTDRYDWSSLGAMAMGAVGVGLLSFLIARPILRLKGHYLAMGTLGMGIIISIVLNQEAEFTGGPDGMAVPAFSMLGWEVDGNLSWYWITGGFLLVTVWLALNLVDSPVGRALRAVHGSELAAATMGVDVLRFKVLIFVVSAVLASLAGSVFAHYSGFLTPSEGEFFRSIELVTMVVLGGMASIFGAVVGAAILTILPQALAAFQDYEMIVFGAILMGMMILMRKGLVPTITEFIRARLP